MNDYYKILNLKNDATENEIKKAFRALALKYHPDQNPGDKTSEEKFKKINDAYAILIDPQKRGVYDQVGHENYKEDIFFNNFSNFKPGFGCGRSKGKGCRRRAKLNKFGSYTYSDTDYEFKK